ncbi:alpha/beta hydrolase [Bacillus cereus group sp. BfR-BA-01329]|uniref:alpha/beta hydrolase n=1 Tax=Bacillus cereus group sp. BfR-BA-01329 TaxID=2920305 RepID=UPI001F57CD06|nr:alpha/beta hydrolase family protein [Bacillus cereus group sp. BfR-BA-01329]
MIFSKFIDLCALYDLHRKRSKEWHFSKEQLVDKNMKLDEFYKYTPQSISFEFRSEEKDSKVGTFEYMSSVTSGYSNNDKVTGEVFLHKDDAPNVILVHGWRMESNDRIKNIYHDKFMELGWNTYYFTLPYHFEREPNESLFSGEYMVSAHLERTVQASKQAVVDLRQLINWVKNNKKGPIIVIGISLGGFVTNLTALVEENIDVLIGVFYANRLSYSIWNTNPGKYIKKDLIEHNVTYNELIKAWEITEPSQSIPKVKKENILLISGKHDQYVVGEDTDYLWNVWGKPTRYLYNCGHSGIVLNRKKIAHDTIQFIRKRIEG